MNTPQQVVITCIGPVGRESGPVDRLRGWRWERRTKYRHGVRIKIAEIRVNQRAASLVEDIRRHFTRANPSTERPLNGMFFASGGP